MAVRAYEKGLELLCEVDPRVPALVMSDPVRLTQVLTNLVSNAIKFTRQGEVVTRVAVQSENESEVVLRFSVRDTGIGVPGDKLTSIFEKFTQADSSTTRRFGGTGLGLAIAKQLAERMGGEIGAMSPANGSVVAETPGSEFWFTSKMLRGSVLTASPNTLQDALRGVRVLVASDHRTSRELIARQLGTWGMRVSEAEDGPAAFQAIDQVREALDPFAVVLLGLHAGRTGNEARAKMVRVDPRNGAARLVAIVLAGKPGTDALDNAGVAACVVKPVRFGELLRTLSAVVSGDTEVRALRQSPTTTSR